MPAPEPKIKNIVKVLRKRKELSKIEREGDNMKKINITDLVKNV
jgi:hypothetical protein